MSEPLPRQISTFVRIGGDAAIDRLVEAFYARMDTIPEARTIRAMHAHDLGPMKTVLKWYLTEWLGGPKLYSTQRGHPRLRGRHLGFRIDEVERDAWLLCMRGAVQDTIEDVETRDRVLAAFEKLADWMRNQPGNPHDTRESQ